MAAPSCPTPEDRQIHRKVVKPYPLPGRIKPPGGRPHRMGLATADAEGLETSLSLPGGLIHPSGSTPLAGLRHHPEPVLPASGQLGTSRKLPRRLRPAL